MQYSHVDIIGSMEYSKALFVFPTVDDHVFLAIRQQETTRGGRRLQQCHRRPQANVPKEAPPTRANVPLWRFPLTVHERWRLQC